MRVDGVLQLTERYQVDVAELQENIRESMKQYFRDIRAHLDAKEKEFNDELDTAAQLCWHQDEVIRQSLKTHKDKVCPIVDWPLYIHALLLYYFRLQLSRRKSTF